MTEQEKGTQLIRLIEDHKAAKDHLHHCDSRVLRIMRAYRDVSSPGSRVDIYPLDRTKLRITRGGEIADRLLGDLVDGNTLLEAYWELHDARERFQEIVQQLEALGVHLV